MQPEQFASRNLRRLFFSGLMIIGCSATADVDVPDIVPALPEPVSNNSVAMVSTETGQHLISFMGLGPEKTWQSVHNKVFTLKLGDEQWQMKTPVPSSLSLAGRLASIAVGVGKYAYIFGGYTVAKDHTEISSPDNFRYSVDLDEYDRIADMPVAVDDAVAVVYQQRFIYIISGWHNDGNVNLVQVYDIKTDSWQQASPFPGTPVFGHAGGIVNSSLIVCDGVAVKYYPKKRRGFASQPECFIGKVDNNDVTRISWNTLDHPTGIARYRMAATGVSATNQIMFVGGSKNPYNYDGIGYNGEASEPTSAIWLYDVSMQTWKIETSSQASMDHRGLLLIDDKAIRIGGMLGGQQPSTAVIIDQIGEVK